MPIPTSQLKGENPFLYIASYNKSKTQTGLSTIKNPILDTAVLNQIGLQAYAEFKDDFINYKSGLILCVNTHFDLNKFFATSSLPNSGNLGIGAYSSLPNNVVFTVVTMPQQFINKKGSLTKDYDYGEKLRVLSSQETTGSTIYQIPNASASRQAVTNKSLVSYITRRDANMIGRSVKSQSTGGGGGVGVWS
jgi:hypothetical protein